MKLRRALFIAACLLPTAAGMAAAQFQPPPQQRQQESPCLKDFSKLRDDATKKAKPAGCSTRSRPPRVR
jgi:hypothetical protein